MVSYPIFRINNNKVIPPEKTSWQGLIFESGVQVLARNFFWVKAWTPFFISPPPNFGEGVGGLQWGVELPRQPRRKAFGFQRGREGAEAPSRGAELPNGVNGNQVKVALAEKFSARWR